MHFSTFILTFGLHLSANGIKTLDDELAKAYFKIDEACIKAMTVDIKCNREVTELNRTGWQGSLEDDKDNAITDSICSETCHQSLQQWAATVEKDCKEMAYEAARLTNGWEQLCDKDIHGRYCNAVIDTFPDTDGDLSLEYLCEPCYVRRLWMIDLPPYSPPRDQFLDLRDQIKKKCPEILKAEVPEAVIKGEAYEKVSRTTTSGDKTTASSESLITPTTTPPSQSTTAVVPTESNVAEKLGQGYLLSYWSMIFMLGRTGQQGVALDRAARANASLDATSELMWSIERDEVFNKRYNICCVMYSRSPPGVTDIVDPEESAAIARQMNKYSAQLRDKYPNTGFFATVPSLQHTALVLQELRYAFDTLEADGITLFTSYAIPQGYLGHPEYVSIWEELNSRKAVVFVHPTDNVAGVSFDERLPMPAFDWPHETGRTAIDMILNRRLEQFPDVKIILSHGGGTLIPLIRRSTMISFPEFGGVMSAQDMINQAKQFYFDTTLAGSKEMFPMILEFAKPGHLLFGSDFPQAPEKLSKGYTKFVDDFPMDDEKRKQIYSKSALNLFPRLKSNFYGR
ncbi:hypothetical protein FGRMN_10132 [Fusarium graminum]|nr:hypothetical protein FGRMN_10132 [Fusarium graminum]